MEPLYLDYNATTPLDPAVVQAMLPYYETHFGNPSSDHPFGERARAAVDRARGQVAAMLEADPGEIVFTSGGTEANNHAIRGVAAARRSRGNHLVTSAVEHPAVTEVCRHLEACGYEVTTVGVDRHGRVDPDAVEEALRPDTILVSVMLANNEVGTVQPVRDIAERAHARGIPMHTDAAQAVGKIPVSVAELGVDLLSVAGHKFYGPKGVGALFIRSGFELPPLIFGANHEAGRRAGTENVAQIVGLGEASRLAGCELEARSDHMLRMRDRLYAAIAAETDGVEINGHPVHRLPNTLSLAFRGLAAGALLAAMEGVAASAGAACHADGVTLSKTLEAMGLPLDFAAGTLRLSTGMLVTEEEVDRAAAIIVRAVRRLRAA